MNNTKLIFSLLSFFSAFNIDSGWAMMSAMEPLKTIARIAVKKRAPQILQRRSMHTQGHKPKELIQSEFQFDNITKEKIRFTDDSHERYLSEVTDPSLKERIALTEQINAHTLLVNIIETEEDAPPAKAQDQLNKDKSSLNMQAHATHAQLKTKGFRPDNPIKVDKWHTLNLPKKVEWVGDSYEVVKAPEGFQEMLKESLSRIDRE